MNARGWVSLGVVLFCSLTARSSPAQAPLDFPLDTQLGNTLQASGNISGFTIQSQNQGSLATGTQGHLRTIVGDDGIAFPGGSVVDFKPSATPQQPAAGGVAGSAAADYGFTLQVPLGSGQAAIRNLAFDLTGFTPYDFTPPMPPVPFSLTPISFTIISGTLDYSLESLQFPSRAGSVSLAGLTGSVGGAGRVLQSFDQRINLILDMELTIPFSTVAPNDSRLVLDGFVVTDGLLPEPTAFTLALPAVAWTLRRRRMTLRRPPRQ